MDIRLILGVLWDYAARLSAAVWASLAAFVATPSVWLAAPLFLVVGFSLGHWERGRVVTRLVGEKSTLSSRVDELTADLNLAVKVAREAKAAYDAEIAKRAAATEPPAIDKVKAPRKAGGK